jgi:hypothetical protein
MEPYFHTPIYLHGLHGSNLDFVVVVVVVVVAVVDMMKATVQ